jgi:hypothetical protein
MKHHRKVVSEVRFERREFMKRLRFRWQDGIDQLWFFREVAIRIGADIHNLHGGEAARREDALYFAILRIHGRACLIMSEVIALLETGHPSGALGRWRSLHELAVIAKFLDINGQVCAKRFLDHHAITSAKQARAYQDFCDQLGYPPMKEDEITSIEGERDRLVQQYSKSFDKDWGWADGYFSGPLSFAGIEKAAKLDAWRPHYIWASSAVHGGSKGLLSDLGYLASGGSTSQIPAGPSDYGLADPAILSAIALNSCTRTLAGQRPNDEIVVMCEALEMIFRSLEETFAKTQRKLDKEIEQGLPESDEPVL